MVLGAREHTEAGAKDGLAVHSLGRPRQAHSRTHQMRRVLINRVVAAVRRVKQSAIDGELAGG